MALFTVLNINGFIYLIQIFHLKLLNTFFQARDFSLHDADTF